MFKHESFVLFHLNTFVTEQIEELYSVFSKKGKRRETEQVGVKSSFIYWRVQVALDRSRKRQRLQTKVFVRNYFLIILLEYKFTFISPLCRCLV